MRSPAYYIQSFERSIKLCSSAARWMENEAATRDADAYRVISRGSIGRKDFNSAMCNVIFCWLLLMASYISAIIYPSPAYRPLLTSSTCQLSWQICLTSLAKAPHTFCLPLLHHLVARISCFASRAVRRKYFLGSSPSLDRQKLLSVPRHESP